MFPPENNPSGRKFLYSFSPHTHFATDIKTIFHNTQWSNSKSASRGNSIVLCHFLTYAFYLEIFTYVVALMYTSAIFKIYDICKSHFLL